MRKTLSLLLLSVFMLSSCQASGSGLQQGVPTVIPPSKSTEPGAAPAVQVATERPAETPAGTAQPVGSSAGSPASGARVMALGIRPSLVLRTSPSASASAAATVSDATVLWVEGQTEDGEWLRVAYGDDNGLAWVDKRDVTLWGTLDSIPVLATPVAQATPPTPEATPEGPEVSGRVISNRLNVRAGPGTDQAILRQLNAGDLITLTGQSAGGEWLRLAGSEGGWVAARYVDLEGVAGALPVVATPSSPVPSTVSRPVLTGKIVFETGSGGDIYIMNADGSGLRKIASGLDPALSPDGESVAYARWDAGQEGLYVLQFTTGKERKVTDARRPRSPTWSPDGRYLAFAHLIRSINCYQTPFGCLDEDRVKQVFGDQDCIDTPVGRFCLSDFPLVSMDETGLAQVPVASDGWRDLPAEIPVQAPQWHPQRNDIVYRVPKGLQVTSPDGDTRPLVADNPRIQSPAWSPDGTQVAVQIYQHDHYDIFLLDGSGNVQTALTRREPLSTRAVHNVSPAWSPDGRHILFFTDRDGSWRMYRMDADGSNQAPFLPEVLGKIAFRYDFAAERMVDWGP